MTKVIKNSQIQNKITFYCFMLGQNIRFYINFQYYTLFHKLFFNEQEKNGTR